jgi:hypothetical protein
LEAGNDPKGSQGDEVDSGDQAFSRVSRRSDDQSKFSRLKGEDSLLRHWGWRKKNRRGWKEGNSFQEQKRLR